MLAVIIAEIAIIVAAIVL